MKLVHIVGARPNFPKLAPVHRAAGRAGIKQLIVHTGQHYDDALSAEFFDHLSIPKPDFDLGVGSASHAVQTARIMERLEGILEESQPTWVLVYGDVNSTVAAALVASKLGLRIAHVEAGLRSGDRSMPEEINRIVTDRLADLLLAPSRDAVDVLRREGEPETEIFFVGNVMIDTMLHTLARARASGFRSSIVSASQYAVVTLHRPSNVDSQQRLETIVDALSEIAADMPVLFPIHPRTHARLTEWDVAVGPIQILPALNYVHMLDLLSSASVVITDSGGIQEETTALGVPCFTLRNTTERPITISEGTNQLVPDVSQLPKRVRERVTRTPNSAPEGWDGKAAERIVEVLIAQPNRLK